MKRRIIIGGLAIGLGLVTFGCPIARADMPSQVVEVKPSTGTAADVSVQTRRPDHVQTPPHVPLITRVLRWIQQILGGAIFLPG